MPSTTSTVSYPGNGTTTTFSIPYEYIQEGFIRVTVNDTPTAFTFSSPGSISITPAPAAGTTVRITRRTDLERLVNYIDGSILLARTANLAEVQLLHLIQELNDRSLGGSSADLSDVYGRIAQLEERLTSFRPRVLEDFGFGDTSDFTTALETAWAFMAVNGGRLQLPGGEHTLTRFINITGTNARPYRIMGEGMYETAIARAFPGAASVVSIAGHSRFGISDLTIDGKESVYANGIHGLRMMRTPGATVQGVRVVDWGSSGILHADELAFDTAQHDNITVRECILDGNGNQANGILLANTRYGMMMDNRVLNIGKAKDPAFALQYKGRNSYGTIQGGVATNASVGVAMGASDMPAPANTHMTASGVVTQGCHWGVRVGFVDHLSIENMVIEMSEDATALRAVGVLGCNYGSLSGLVVNGFAPSTAPVWIHECTQMEVDVAHIRTITAGAPIVQFQGASANNVACFGRVSGPQQIYTEAWVSHNANSNTVRFRDRPSTQLADITTGTIAVPNRAVSAVTLTHSGTPTSRTLTTITGGIEGQQLTLNIDATGHTAVIAHGTGNIYLRDATNRTLDTSWKALTLKFNQAAAGWIEV